MRIIKILLLFIVASAIISCDDDICTLETQSLLNTEFIVLDPALTTYVDSLSIYSPEWSDSIHYWKEGSDKTLSFMLSPNDSSTTIILTSKHEVLKDTIRISHQNEMFFLSPECGFILNFEINTISHTNNLIDSILLVGDKISNDLNGHVQVYL